jgi:hypothetical protein
MNPRLTDRHLRALEAVGRSGATRQALGDLVTTGEFVDLINYGLVTNRLADLREDTDTPDDRSNVWYLTEAGANLVDLAVARLRNQSCRSSIRR